jgi:hypothetical protein
MRLPSPSSREWTEDDDDEDDEDDEEVRAVGVCLRCSFLPFLLSPAP